MLRRTQKILSRGPFGRRTGYAKSFIVDPTPLLPAKTHAGPVWEDTLIKKDEKWTQSAPHIFIILFVFRICKKTSLISISDGLCFTAAGSLLWNIVVDCRYFNGFNEGIQIGAEEITPRRQFLLNIYNT